MILLDLIRINEVVENYGISSRTLRYYEEMGLIWSTRPDFKTQRYYDNVALERLKQIIILRKLQIPVKDMVVIFKSESMSALIQAFVNKLESLDTEISALSELRQVVDDFLHKMLMSGITRISGITLLYEEIEKRLTQVEKNKAVTFEKLSKISREALRLHDVRIIRLPSMRFLTSRLRTGHVENLDDKMEDLFAKYGLIPTPGLRNCFYHKEPNGDWIMLMKIPEDYENTSEYIDEKIPSGLYAIASSFMEDMDDTLILLKDWVNKSDHFELDVNAEGELQRHEMFEEILPWDIAKKLNRYQQDIFIPIRIKNDDVQKGSS